jgi:hypothetical protein
VCARIISFNPSASPLQNHTGYITVLSQAPLPLARNATRRREVTGRGVISRLDASSCFALGFTGEENVVGNALIEAERYQGVERRAAARGQITRRKRNSQKNSGREEQWHDFQTMHFG